MKVAAITITYNRLELTKKTVDSFQNKTTVDYHLFIDNGSTDGTIEWLEDYNHILLEKNYGIAYAFREAVRTLEGFDFVLKLDNDIETVTEDIISKMLKFYDKLNYVCSPVDLALDPAFAPPVLGKENVNGYNCQFTTHTGGAFQLIPIGICQKLCTEFTHLKYGDYMIGKYYRKHGYKPTYLMDLQMRHIGLNQSSKNYIL
jgi:glycosyltransferase involved in cell wall biosynthesis